MQFKIYVRLLYLKFSGALPETHEFCLIWPYQLLSAISCVQTICKKRSKPSSACAQEYYVELLFNALFTKDDVTWEILHWYFMAI